MEDMQFIGYLGWLLLNSGYDCCSCCAFCPKDNRDGQDTRCDNLKANDPPDDIVCIEGLRKYAEQL